MIAARAAALAALLLAAPAPVLAEEAPPAPPATAEDPPAAVVHGKPIPRREAWEELARRRFRGEDAERLLEQFAGEIVVRAEQARRGVTVPEDEVRARVEDARRRLAERMARAGRKVEGQDPLEALLRESGNTMETFLEETRYFLALERMAREDLGLPGEVSEAQASLWVRDLVRKREVVTDPAKLPSGTIARVGGEDVPLARAGAWLARRVRTGDLLVVVNDLAFGRVVEARAAEAGVAAGAEEIAAEYDRIAREFEREPSIEGTGVTFDRWLRDRQGLTPEEYRASATFRTRVLARKVVAAGISEEAVKAAWEEDRDAYGETARVRRILVRGEDKAGVFGAAARPMAEAKAIAERALAEIVAGRPFETVARKYSEDVAREEARGQPLDVTPRPKQLVLPDTVLEEIFKAKAGETVGPVKAIDGWHLVRVERRLPAPTFEECRARVRENLVAAGVRKWRGAIKDDPAVVVAKDL